MNSPDRLTRLIAILGVGLSACSLAWQFWLFRSQSETRITLSCSPILAERIAAPRYFFKGQDIEVPFYYRCIVTNSSASAVYLARAGYETSLIGNALKKRPGSHIILRSPSSTFEDSAIPIERYDSHEKRLTPVAMPLRLESREQVAVFLSANAWLGAEHLEKWPRNQECLSLLRAKGMFMRILEACVGGHVVSERAKFLLPEDIEYSVTTAVHMTMTDGTSAEDTTGFSVLADSYFKIKPNGSQQMTPNQALQPTTVLVEVQ